MQAFELAPNLLEAFLWGFGAAIFCGGIIGLERQIRGKTVGLKICILIVLTTSFFVSLTTEISEQSSDIARVIAATVTGVGFLGAGVIFRDSGSASGITTAALIWALAAVGCAIGLGYPFLAVIATICIILVWLLVDAAEYFFPTLRRNSESPRFGQKVGADGKN